MQKTKHFSEGVLTDPVLGLTSDQVNLRTAEGLANEAVAPPSKTVAQIISGNVFTYFNLIFASLAALLILVGSFRDLTFLPIIIANTCIGIFQEIRSKRVLDRLTMLNAPKTRVIRDGTEQTVPSEQLVLGDIVLFSAGNQICADANIVSGEVQVNESLLTGEADEITKTAGDQLLSGSFIVSGKCRARLEKVGAQSYISRLTLEAKKEKKGEKSEMMRSLNKLIKCVGFIIIPIGLVMFYQQFFLMHEPFAKSIVTTVAALLGMIPEGLVLLASVALAVSVIRLARKRVLVHEMSCIESLARVNVLCVDKTGTITENSMQVDKVVPLPSCTANEQMQLTSLLSDFSASMENDNVTMQALKDYFTSGKGRKADTVISFSPKTKYSGASFDGEMYILGAPEFVLLDDYSIYQSQIESYSQKGSRVLVFGRAAQPLSDKALTTPIKPLCLLLLSNPIRKDARETFSYFTKQGVEIKVISGDNPVTVSEVAKQAGILHADSYVDAATLETQEQIEAAVQQFTVFGRVTPQQKKQFVDALHKAGKTVAMTGDGVNDVLALKAADCSVAMASGSEAASHASQLVLLDSDFACMPAVVLEGRRVVNNIERTSCLFLIKNIFSFLMSMFSIVTLMHYPLVPSQMSLISMFTIGIPAFFLALETNPDIIRGKFLTNVLLSALPAGFTNFLVVSTFVIFGEVFALNTTDISTASTLLLATVGMLLLYRISRPMNTYRICLWSAMLVGLIGSCILLNDLFTIHPLSLKASLLLVVFAFVTEPVLRYSSRMVTAVRSFFSTKLQLKHSKSSAEARMHRRTVSAAGGKNTGYKPPFQSSRSDGAKP